MKYLIDTDWVVHYLHGNLEISRKLTELKPEGLAISVITLAEIYEGIYYSNNPVENENGFRHFLTGVKILSVNDGICKVFGLERGKLRKHKKMIGDLDLLIASTCLQQGLTLLSNNRKHYELIVGLHLVSSITTK